MFATLRRVLFGPTESDLYREYSEKAKALPRILRRDDASTRLAKADAREAVWAEYHQRVSAIKGAQAASQVRAYGEKFFRDLRSDNDAVGWTWERSSNPDLGTSCDQHEGFHLKGEGPTFPGHPTCTCYLSAAYRIPKDHKTMRISALALLPLLALVACSESATAPIAETPDPFWIGTKPAVRVTVLDGTKDAPATDRVGRVRIDVLWDSSWTPGATDRRAIISGPTDSVMRFATIGRTYFSGDTLGQSPNIRAGAFDVSIQRTLSFEQDVYCPGKIPQISIGAALLRGSPDAYVIEASGTVYCAVTK